MSVGVFSDFSIMTPKISILMAVFNAAHYLRESIESIRHQTLTDWELIAIDDASTDCSNEILSEYALKDPRIHVVTMSQNGGQGKARNEGLQFATGQYICFVDSDDCLASNALQRIVEQFEATPDADSVLFRLVFWYSDGRCEAYPMPDNYDADGETAFKDSLTWKIHGVYAVRVAIHRQYLYDTSSHAYSDDNTTRMHFLASRRVVSANADYYYRQHPQSVTHRVDGRRFDYLTANASMKRQLLKLKVDDALLTLYENERWKNLIDVYQFYYLHHRQLDTGTAKAGWKLIRQTWKSIEVHRLRASLRCKFGYMPFQYCWELFVCQENAYFFLRGLLGKNKGK